MHDGAVVFNTKLNTSGIDKDWKKVEKKFDDAVDVVEDGNKDIRKSFDKVGDKAEKVSDTIEDSFDNAFKNIASASAFANFATDALQRIGDVAIDVARESIDAAADVKAASAQFSQTFKGVEKTARESLNAISDEVGIASSRIQESYTSIFAFTRSVGAQTADALDISRRAMTAAADSAAYYDRSIEDVTESLQSFLKGNFENDSALGIAATETTRNAKANELYAKSFDRLSESQKVDVLLAMVEAGNKASGALGQAAREADNWANVTAELSEAWKQNIAVFGEGFIEDLTPAVKWLTSELNEYVELRNKLKEKKGDTNPLVDDVAAFELAAEDTAAAVQKLRQEYDAAKEAARQSLDAQIGLFDELMIQSDIGAKTIIENWQSQREAFAQYAENLQKAVNLGLDEALVQQLSDGTAESMSILNALVNDTDLSIDDINSAFQGVSESRDTVSSVMAEVQTEMSDRLSEMAKDVSEAWPEMARTVGNEISKMQNYIDGLTGSTVYIDVITRYFDSGRNAGTSYTSPVGYSAEPAAAYALPDSVPYLASGAVIPPNAPFMAILGDQKNGTNIEAPLETIKQALAEVMGEYSRGDISINFTGDLAQLARILKPQIDRENKRVGTSLNGGETVWDL